MAGLVFCNACFQKPQGATLKFSLTNCGHVICEPCLQKGKKDCCVICRAHCNTIQLSKKMNSNIQSLFMPIDGLCSKYSNRVKQISQFQEKHRKHLLTHYRGKIKKLEVCLKNTTQQMQHIQQLQNLRPLQETTRLPANPSEKPSFFIPQEKRDRSSYSLRRTHPSTSEMVPSKEADYFPPSAKKTEKMAGPTRLSLLAPPQNGCMGSVSYRISQLPGMIPCGNSISASVRSSPLRTPSSGISFMSPFGSSQNARSNISDDFRLRTPQYYQHTPLSSLSSVTRPAIRLPNLLERQHIGASSLGGH